MVLVDSSAWIEYLRATGSEVDVQLNDLIVKGTSLAVTDVVMLEVLAGARDDADAQRLRRLLLSCAVLPARDLTDYEEAARLSRRCRASGDRIRSLLDCLIAAISIRAGAALLHKDRDFDVIARHSSLRLARTSAARSTRDPVHPSKPPRGARHAPRS